jgi:hypothetical protein
VTQFAFTQALYEAVKAAKQTLFVVSIPASESSEGRYEALGRKAVSDIEVGGERGGLRK